MRWIAIALIAAGQFADYLTTVQGLRTPGVHEANRIVRTFGVAPVKLATGALLAASTFAVSEQHALELGIASGAVLGAVAYHNVQTVNRVNQR